MKLKGALAADDRYARARAPLAGGCSFAVVDRVGCIGVLGPDDFVADGGGGLGGSRFPLRGRERVGVVVGVDLGHSGHDCGYFVGFLFFLLSFFGGLGLGGKCSGERWKSSVDGFQTGLHCGVAEDDQWAGLGDVAVPDAVGEALEEGAERVIVALRNRIEFVVVALRAARGEPEPDGRGGIDAVDIIAGLGLFLDGAALGRGEVVAVVAGRDELIDAWIGQQITGELLNRELIERHIAVVGRRDPVAVGPDGADVVEMEAVGVGVAHGVEPGAREMLAEAWGGEEPRDHAVECRCAASGRGSGGSGRGGRRVVREEGVELGRSGRESGEIQSEAAEERFARGFGREGELVAVEFRGDEVINRAADFFGAGQGGREDGAGNGLESPVVLVDGALLDPALEECTLRGRQRFFVRVGRRHNLVGILAEDALPRFRIRKVTGHDGADTAAVGGGGVELVEAEFGFAIAGIAAVAGETIIGQDRADVFVITHRVDGRGGRRRDEGQSAKEEAKEG